MSDIGMISGVVTEADILSKSEVETVQQKKNELKHIGSLKKVPGHTLFSFNYDTGEIKRAEFERNVTLNIYGQPIYEERVLVEKSCYYEQALNEKNFIKRLKRRGYVNE